MARLEIFKKILSYYQSVQTWILSAITFVLTWLGETTELLIYIVLVCVIDMILGIWRSYRNNIALTSSGIRQTIGKLSAYFIVIVCAVMVDKAVNIDSIIVTRAVCVIAITAEVWSILANLCILFPGVPAIKIARKFLISEIAEKVNIETTELEQFLNNKEKYDV